MSSSTRRTCSPTCLQIAGLEVAPEGLVYKDYQGNPANLDGVSLASILFDSTTAVRDRHTGYLLTEVGYNGIKVGARNSTYKVIRRQYFPNQNLFYNLIDDPLEEYPLTPPRQLRELYQRDVETGD